MARTIVKTITSASGRYRAEIIQRASGGFQVEVQRWTEEYVPGYGKVAEFWEPLAQGATFTDTLDRAEELARDDLRLCEPATS